MVSSLQHKLSKYRIYRIEANDKILLAEPGTSQFALFHPGVEKDKACTYAIVSVHKSGRESNLAFVTVK